MRENISKNISVQDTPLEGEVHNMEDMHGGKKFPFPEELMTEEFEVEIIRYSGVIFGDYIWVFLINNYQLLLNL